MLNAAAWGLTDLVDDGTVSKKAAEEMLAHLFEQMMAPTGATGRRTKAAASPRQRKRESLRKGK